MTGKEIDTEMQNHKSYYEERFNDLSVDFSNNLTLENFQYFFEVTSSIFSCKIVLINEKKTNKKSSKAINAKMTKLHYFS